MIDPVLYDEARADMERESLQEKLEFRAQDIYAELVDDDRRLIDALDSSEWSKSTYTHLLRSFREGDQAAIGRTIYLLMKDRLFDEAMEQARREWWEL